jgi:hypothetical protein
LHLSYLKYVVRHKFFVLCAGLPLGVSPFRLLLHDWTKFLPREWFPYATFFNGPKLDKTGEALKFGAFQKAWNHHQKKNDHHWQFWLLQMDDGGPVIPLAMSEQAKREMLADWRGAGRALGMPDTRQWYLDHKDVIILHPRTRVWVEMQLGV